MPEPDNALTLLLMQSIIPDYAEGLPIHIENVLYDNNGTMVEIVTCFYPDSDHSHHELIEILGWLIFDITQEEDWKLFEITIDLFSGHMTGIAKFRR